MKRKIILLMGLVVFCMALWGCGQKAAGVKQVQTSSQKVLMISADAPGEVQVHVERMEKDKQTDTYRAVQTFQPGSLQGENLFAVVLEEKGIYQVTLSCDGCTTLTRAVHVTGDQMYMLELVLSPESD